MLGTLVGSWTLSNWNINDVKADAKIARNGCDWLNLGRVTPDDVGSHATFCFHGRALPLAIDNWAGVIDCIEA
jgi:hypothetical protein